MLALQIMPERPNFWKVVTSNVRETSGSGGMYSVAATLPELTSHVEFSEI